MSYNNISTLSTSSDILDFLRHNDLEDAVQEFQRNQVDGEDFFDLDLTDIYFMIPRLKLRKKFIKAWSRTFDVHGKRIFLQKGSTTIEDGTPLQPSATSISNTPIREHLQPVATSSFPITPIPEQISQPDAPIQSISTTQIPEHLSQPLADSISNTSVSKHLSHSMMASINTTVDSTQPSFCMTGHSTEPLATFISASSVPSTHPSLLVAPCSSTGSVNELTYSTTQMNSSLQPQSSTSPLNAPLKRKLCSDDSIIHEVTPSKYWLDAFVIPSTWSPDVEGGLEKQYLNPAQKNAMIRQICSSIMAVTNTTKRSERNQIAILLLEKYPFLKGSSETDYEVWAKKMEERIFNVRRKAARNERKKLKEEGIVVPKAKPGRKKMAAEAAIMLTEEALEALEELRVELVKVVQNKPVDVCRQKDLMDATFPLRRRAVLKEDMEVWEVVRNYPCLQDPAGIELRAELGRIIRPCVDRVMQTNWETARPKILQALKKIDDEEIQNNLAILEDSEASDNLELENRCIFACLSFALGEKSNAKTIVGELFWHIIPTYSDFYVSSIISSSTTPRLLSTGTTNELESLHLIGDGTVIVSFNPQNILEAVIALISSFYTFNYVYPKGRAANIYSFLEHVMIGKREPLPTGVETFLGSM
ncbi:predicted protein [Nematostella vectensis]|uniref:Uncharacterized protein n=1 Tax=Nematostella vectensis TaxID=45351 RepID=A7S696_NEMVE|nr:predicted protein [Nematostella vectensis]|eukprot:XP_001632840.1 predicted protein [Nematostella vectensis]